MRPPSAIVFTFTISLLLLLYERAMIGVGASRSVRLFEPSYRVKSSWRDTDPFFSSIRRRLFESNTDMLEPAERSAKRLTPAGARKVGNRRTRKESGGREAEERGGRRRPSSALAELISQIRVESPHRRCSQRDEKADADAHPEVQSVLHRCPLSASDGPWCQATTSVSQMIPYSSRSRSRGAPARRSNQPEG